MKKRISVYLIGMLLVFLLAGTAHAALIVTGEDYVYDDCLDITLLRDANYAWTLGIEPYPMDYFNAYAWTEELEFEGHTDWRLPTLEELVHLFNVENVRANYPYDPQSAPFTNLLPYDFWTNVGSHPSGYVDTVYSADGSLMWKSPTAQQACAWAVHPGQIPTPLPGAVWLFGSGLACFGFIRRKAGRRHSVIG